MGLRIIGGVLALLLSSFTIVVASEDGGGVESGVFVVGLSSIDVSLDPLQSYSADEAQIFSAIYEGLVSYDPATLNPVPAVAESWARSRDKKTYTFSLREESRFWNGDPVTATDFFETWLLLIDPDRSSPYSFLLDSIIGVKEYRSGREKDPRMLGFRADGDYKFVVELAEPMEPFIKVLCHHSFVPLHSSIRDLVRSGTPLPGSGNGPFMIVDATQSQITLSKNPAYWDAESVKTEQLQLRSFEDPEMMAELFNEGLIHWVIGDIALEKVSVPDSVVLNPLFATTFLYFNSNSAPLNDFRISRALSLLLPWGEIRSEDIYHTPATTLVPPIPNYPKVEGITAPNKEEALALLEEAGYPDGAGLPELTIFIPTGLSSSHVFPLVKESWEGVLEVSVVIKTAPYRRYYEALEEEHYSVGILSWIGDFADPLTFLQIWASDSNLNSSAFASPEYDSLLEQANRESEQKRLETLASAEELLLQRGVALPISHQPALNVIDLGAISGWYPNPMDIHPFKHIAFRIPEPPPNIATVKNRGYRDAPLLSHTNETRKQ